MGWILICALGLGSLAFLLWLEIRSERRQASRAEAQDKADFEAYAPRPQEWSWLPKWQPSQEYVAKPKERAK